MVVGVPREVVGGDDGEVHVTWGRDGAAVTVGGALPNADDGWDEFARILGGHGLALGNVTTSGPPGTAQLAALRAERLTAARHVTLSSRGAVNRLIRVLRNARDQAFGRDE